MMSNQLLFPDKHVDLIHFSGKDLRGVQLPGGMKPVPDEMRVDFPIFKKRLTV